MLDVIQAFAESSRPVKDEFEARLARLSGSKRSNQQLRQPGPQGMVRPVVRKSSSTVSTSPSQIAAFEDAPPTSDDRPRISSTPSQGSLAMAMPNYRNVSPSPSYENGLTPGYAPAGPSADYFVRDRTTSPSPSPSIAKDVKKKGPPPPPPKRIQSQQGLWVTALYDFVGQGQGDLTIREGDRIRVLRKTESTNDWWEGELNGVAGSFPANYCQA